MFKFPGIFHLLASLAAINIASGNHTAVPTPKKPKVFGFGWPKITLVTAFVEAIPIEGIIQYEWFYNKTCHFLPSEKCSSVITDLSPVDGCRKVENQTSASATIKVSSCTICNSTKVCDFMGITKDDDLCLYLKVTTSFGSAHVCMEHNYADILVFPPPKTIRILATKNKQLTVLWEHPEGIDPSGIQINYIVIRQDHLGQCKIKELYGEGSINTFNFTGLNPWSNYSVTICSALQMSSIPVNTTACTCGDNYHLPGGPVFNLTLPEEPSERPLLQPCEALCVDTNFSAILKWKASGNLMWNGIPTKSVIRIYIWNSSSPDIACQDESKLGIAVATFFVPLGSNYNGSFMTFHVNLKSHLTYVAMVQFCSNGGCGPCAVATLSCDVCESLGLPDELSGKPSPSPSAKSYWPEIGVGVSCFILVVAVVTVLIKRKKRQRNHQTIQETIGNLQPENDYEDPDFADMTSDDGPYSPLCSSESQVLLMDNQTETAQRV